jgi:hypothetical protein
VQREVHHTSAAELRSLQAAMASLNSALLAARYHTLLAYISLLVAAIVKVSS